MRKLWRSPRLIGWILGSTMVSYPIVYAILLYDDLLIDNPLLISLIAVVVDFFLLVSMSWVLWVKSKTVVSSENLTRRSFLADFLLPIKISNDLHANLDEAMPLWIAAHGERRALWIRRSQQAHTIAKFWMTPLRNLFQAVFKLIR